MRRNESPHDQHDRNPARPRHWRDAFAVYLKPRVLIVLFLGFSAGLPLALSGSTLVVWMREVGVDLGTIGLFTLVGTPYTIKFLWAPVVDALDVPVLSRLLGRRRGWLMLSQLLLMAAIVIPRASAIPQISPLARGVGAAAGRRRVGDAGHRDRRIPGREPRTQRAGRRHGVLCRGLSHRHAGLDRGRALRRQRLRARSASARTRVVARLCGDGRDGRDRHGHHAARHRAAQRSAAAMPSTRRIERQSGQARRRRGRTARSPSFSPATWRSSSWSFVVLYKFCDAFAGAMTAPFVIDLGFTRTDYANIVKGLGLAATLIGGFAGGFVARAYPLATCLWIGAFLQMASNLVFSWQAYMGLNHWALAVTITVGEFHRRDRHGDLRRVSVGAVPIAAAHRDAIRAAHRARRRSAAPICRPARASSPRRPAGPGSSSISALAAVPGLVPAVVAAGARAFPQARPGEGDGAASRLAV